MYGAALDKKKEFKEGQQVQHVTTSELGTVQAPTCVEGQFDRVPVRFPAMFDGAVVPVLHTAIRAVPQK